jgi:transcriptional regulator with XRE-family HTH domain
MIEQPEKDIRTQMLEALAKYNIKQVDVAREAGIHHSTLSLWLQGKVKGHHIKIEDTLSEWLDSLYSGRPRYTTLNKTVDKQFVLTPAVTNVLKKRTGENDQILIPIHFDLELEGKRYKEQFCWNVNDPYFTPE